MCQRSGSGSGSFFLPRRAEQQARCNERASQNKGAGLLHVTILALSKLCTEHMQLMASRADEVLKQGFPLRSSK